MQRLAEEYERALATCLQGPDGAALDLAVALGRKAADRGLGVSELAELHLTAAVAALLSSAGRGQPAEAMEELASSVHAAPGKGRADRLPDASHKIAEFFAASLAPIWEVQRRLLGEHCALVRLNEVREQETRRIGQALHDDAAQMLAAVHLAVEEVAREVESPHRERLQAVRGLLDQTEEQLRCISHNLRPVALDDLGLTRAIELLGDAASRRGGIPVAVRCSVPPQLPAVVESTLYRTVQEGLNNCMRHARASLVTITVETQGKIISCRVKDDGAGFDPQATLSGKGHAGLGLVGIRERIASLGGAFFIQSAPGQGTELAASVPMDTDSFGACFVHHPEMLSIQRAPCD
jgi:signal transduction histidine kinase